MGHSKDRKIFQVYFIQPIVYLLAEIIPVFSGSRPFHERYTNDSFYIYL